MQHDCSIRQDIYTLWNLRKKRSLKLVYYSVTFKHWILTRNEAVK